MCSYIRSLIHLPTKWFLLLPLFNSPRFRVVCICFWFYSKTATTLPSLPNIVNSRLVCTAKKSVRKISLSYFKVYRKKLVELHSESKSLFARYFTRSIVLFLQIRFSLCGNQNMHNIWERMVLPKCCSCYENLWYWRLLFSHHCARLCL